MTGAIAGYQLLHRPPVQRPGLGVHVDAVGVVRPEDSAQQLLQVSRVLERSDEESQREVQLLLAGRDSCRKV